MEKSREECPDALTQCLAKAWEEAAAQLAGSGFGMPSVIGPSGDDHRTGVPHPLFALPKLLTIANLWGDLPANASLPTRSMSDLPFRPRLATAPHGSVTLWVGYAAGWLG